MLKFDSLTIRRGPRVLFAEASFSLFRGEKVGITGENGSGKSSLLALVRGELHPDAGHFSMPSNLSVAHVAQELEAIERVILAAETKAAELDRTLNDPDFYITRSQEATAMIAKQQAAHAEVVRLYARWEKLEAIRKQWADVAAAPY